MTAFAQSSQGHSPVLTSARSYAQSGLSIIPIRPDGSKQPVLPSWKRYQTELPTADEVDDWFADGQKGIAIVCGQVSGGVEVLDFDQADLYRQWREQLDRVAPALAQRLTVVATPRPGIHVYFRSQQPQPSQKLARTADGATLIEVKGEGGYVLAPGSPATCHASGNTYVHTSGPPLTELALLTAAQRDQLFQLARRFDASKTPARDHHGGAFDSSSTGRDVLQRARLYLAKCDPAITGRAGHNQTFKITCRLLHGFHLDDDTAFALLRDDYNPRCQPPWSDGELRHKVASARQDGSSKDLRDQAATEGRHASNGQAGTSSLEDPRQSHSPFPRRLRASELSLEETARHWLWHGYVARGEITLFSALWKAGKTTLLANLVQAFEHGGEFCGRVVSPCQVLYVTEENEHRWALRRNDLGLGDHLSFLIRPFRRKPNWQEWEALIGELERSLQDDPADLIVLDTLSDLWPVPDENAAPEVQRALIPLRRLTTARGLVLVHHLGKADGAQGTGSRGSGALPAFVDTIVELRRHSPQDRADRRRVLTAYSRSQETPPELVVELQPDHCGYVAQGDKQSVKEEQLRQTLRQVLPTDPPGRSYEEIKAKLPEDKRPRKQTIMEELTRGIDSGEYIRDGEGKKGSPYTFWAAAEP